MSTHNYTYAYNELNQLLQETEYVAGSGETYSGYLEITKNYEYDKNGNTLKKTIGGQVDESMVQYTYNAWNQLTQFIDENGVPTTYTYDGTGMRNSKTTNGVTKNFYWDRGYVINEATDGEFTAAIALEAKGFLQETVAFSPKTYMGMLLRAVVML